MSRCRDAAGRGSAMVCCEPRNRLRHRDPRTIPDVVGDRWPAAVDPQPDELLSSWLHRLAIANGVAPRSFAGVLGLGGGMWSPRLDVRLPHERRGLARRSDGRCARGDIGDGDDGWGVGAASACRCARRPAGAVRPGSSIAHCVLPTIALPIFGGRWRLASRISCFRHGCGLRDRCPACRGGIAPFAQTDLIPQYVCARCGFDLRGAAKISVEAAARRLERSIDDICKAEIAKRSPTIHEWVARLLRVPVVAGVGSGRPLANLSASARIRCFERLAQRADEVPVAASNRRHRPTLAAGGSDGLIRRFVDFVDQHQGWPQSARAQPPGVDLAALLKAYVRAVGDRSRSKRRGADASARDGLAT